MTTAETTEILVRVPDGGLPSLFDNPQSIDAVLAEIEATVKASAATVETRKGRDEIKSLAYKVSRSKTALDAAGKDLTEDARNRIKAVDAERKRIRDRLDALRDEVRKPLDEWEEREAQRKAVLEHRLEALKCGHIDSRSEIALIEKAIAGVDETDPESFDELKDDAAFAKDITLNRLRNDLDTAKRRQAEQAELEQLRKEKAEREAREAEERRAREAKEAEERRAREEEENRKRAVERLEAHIRDVRNGQIGGEPQGFGILEYELTTKISFDGLGDDADRLKALRDEALTFIRDEAEKALAKQREEVAEQARRRAEAALAEEKRAEEQAKQEKLRQAEYREKILRACKTALANLPANADEAAAMVVDGKAGGLQFTFEE
jgi:hypothetical protein